ncbi:MAG: hypothetical protein JXQ30_17135 [Spirochaetes bacterium]|nr:hypothetical protein [Spirochaetota bacterium]
MKTLCSFLAVCILFFSTVPAYSVRAQQTDRVPELKASYGPDRKHPAITYEFDFTDKDSDYEETPLRRFEIIFLISLPVSLLITFLGVEGYRVLGGQVGAFNQVEYRYLILSTVGISLGVALTDQQAVFMKERF